ncbi:MAG: NADH:ubiquinone reductase (Na(+)-transporting) subunit C [Paludibacteraceae bacterium]|nr:NADH:ubiquinone reductase (Na(+)-transporting) subunit C [Paludibacteraceae bacterium]
MNTQKNSYVIIYMVVIVVIVSLLLSITSGVLHTRQEDNKRLDTKKQILMSLSTFENDAEVKIYEDENADKVYAETITGYFLIDEFGKVKKELDPVKDFDVKPEEGEYAVYTAEVGGETKYVLPMTGAGLWGGIRAYLALNSDLNTVYGVYFGHDSETPGLGANIVTPRFRQQFTGKEIMKEGVMRSIAVMKKGDTADGQDQVDAISGGTITSKGVESMFANSLHNYEQYIINNRENKGGNE